MIKLILILLILLVTLPIGIAVMDGRLTTTDSGAGGSGFSQANNVTLMSGYSFKATPLALGAIVAAVVEDIQIWTEQILAANIRNFVEDLIW